MRPSFVESFVVEAVKDEQLPEQITGFPGDPTLIRRIMEYCPSMVVEPYEGQDSLPFDNPAMHEPNGLEGLRLEQTSPNHVRSFEIIHPAFVDQWQDEYGHVYTSVNLKGNNYSNPSILETATASDRVIAFGLQESAVIRRVLRASRLLRQNGVPTEYILGMAEPKNFPWPQIDSQTEYSDPVSLPEYKRRLVENHWQALEPEVRTAEALVELSTKFDRMTFFVTMRAMDTSIRLGDVRLVPEARQRIFRYINQHTAYGRENPLDTESNGDIKRYANDFLAPRLAQNIAKIHKLGMAHRYPNEMNVTALGSIVDLDSLHGAPLELGDDPVTVRDMAGDVVELLWAMDAVPLGESKFVKTSGSIDLCKTFLRHYITEMGTEQYGPDVFQILFAAHEILEDSTGPDNIFSSSPGLQQSRIEEVLLESLSSEQKYAVEAYITAWTESKLPELRAELIKELEKNIPTYLRLLMDCSLNEIRDVEFDMVEAFFSYNMLEIHDVYQCMLDDLATYIQKSFKNYMNAQSDATGDETNAAYPPQLYWIYIEQMIIKNQDKGMIWGPIGDLVHSMLPALKDRFIEQDKIIWPTRIFPDIEALPLLRSSQNVFVMETLEVSLAELADYIAASDEEVIIEQMVRPEHIWHNNYEVTDDGSILIEFISDDETNGLSQDVEDDEVFRNLRYDIPLGQYLLFVELKPDGSRRLRIHLKDTELADRLSAASRESIVAALRSHYNVPEQLFDPAEYKRELIVTRY